MAASLRVQEQNCQSYVPRNISSRKGNSQSRTYIFVNDIGFNYVVIQESIYVGN
jgi:hypothetical protein